MIQIDMQMPKNCFDCPACNEYLLCAIPVNGRKWGENDVHDFSESRPEWCPMKEQEAKCLTKAELDDLDENQFVWIEERTGYLYCLQIIGICRKMTGVSDIQFNAPTSYVERSTNTYGKSYRIWTDKPKEEQSQAAKWK